MNYFLFFQLIETLRSHWHGRCRHHGFCDIRLTRGFLHCASPHKNRIAKKWPCEVQGLSHRISKRKYRLGRPNLSFCERWIYELIAPWLTESAVISISEYTSGRGGNPTCQVGVLPSELYLVKFTDRVRQFASIVGYEDVRCVLVIRVFDRLVVELRFDDGRSQHLPDEQFFMGCERSGFKKLLYICG